MRADLINTCLPDRVQSLAIQKQAAIVADLFVADLLFVTGCSCEKVILSRYPQSGREQRGYW